MSTPLALGIGLVLLAANGFFVAAEFALLAARRSRIEQLAADGDKRAVMALTSIKQLSLMLAGAQLGITMCSLGLGMVAEPALASTFDGLLDQTGIEISSALRHTIAFLVALAIVVFLHMVVGEMAPKSWAISHPESSTLLLIRPFRAFSILFRPIIWLLNAMANGVIRLAGVQPKDEGATVHGPADLMLLLDESVGHGSVSPDHHDLLTRSLALSDLEVAAAMTPRDRIDQVDVAASVEDVERTIARTHRSRLLVTDGGIDQIVGVVLAKDLLRLDQVERSEASTRSLTRPTLRTTPDTKLDDLLHEMRAERHHLAVVVDRDQRVTGIVTMEDVLEEIIGEAVDPGAPARQLRQDRRVGAAH
ncbi:MAG: HlyC/CorC family transporter [Acidimicrobiales bacterium]|nr:HlyC/CorC family transporter [Acidimicrobiales bacterium]